MQDPVCWTYGSELLVLHASLDQERLISPIVIGTVLCVMVLSAASSEQLVNAHGENNRNWLAAAEQALQRRDMAKLGELLDKGLSPNATGVEGKTLLMSAAEHECAEAVELLLRRGADVGAKTEQGLTALMYAAMALSDDAVRMLLAAGADPKARTSGGHSALDLARDRLQYRITLNFPFTRTHHMLVLPGWGRRHSVVERLKQAAQ